MAGITQSSHFKEYMFVFVLLAVFTVIELFIPGMEASTHVKGAILTALASIKAFAVAYYYMHLKEEKRWLKKADWASNSISAGLTSPTTLGVSTSVRLLTRLSSSRG